MLRLTDWITFCATRVVWKSISVSFTMFTGARILLASDTGTTTASEDGFDEDSLSRYKRELKQRRRERERERLKRQ